MIFITVLNIWFDFIISLKGDWMFAMTILTILYYRIDRNYKSYYGDEY